MEESGAAEKNDTDPTRPVLFSVRTEFYNPSATVTQAALIFRFDQATLRARRWLPGRRGVILRFEVPLAETHVAGTPRQVGLGDAYGQILVAPRFTPSGAFVVGTGLLVPSASDSLLGAGSGCWRRRSRPCGSSPDAEWSWSSFRTSCPSPETRTGPTSTSCSSRRRSFIRVMRRWWVLADSEMRTNWLLDGRTDLKSGLQVGRHLSGRFAVWVKPERWWGPNQSGQWNLKFGLVWHR